MSKKGDRRAQERMRSGALMDTKRRQELQGREPARIRAEVNQIRSGKIMISEASKEAQEAYLYG